jgi:7-cyano-7-deazaguanine synthase
MSDKREACMVVLSGGQDSTTCLFWAREHFRQVHAITFDYGQAHRIEIEAARKVATMAGVASHEVVSVPKLRGRSPLIDPTASLETYTSFDAMDQIIGTRVELTFVPMRNSLFLTLAANYAVAMDVFELVTGVCEADNANYPDCRGDFIAAQEQAINAALGIGHFEIHTPLLQRTKADSVRLALDIPGAWDALAYTHTCYAGQYPPCGKCHACVLRHHGFEAAGFIDPLELPREAA